MPNWRVVRLNAELFPIDDYEAGLYRQYGIQPIEAEAATPDEILKHVAECDALFAISVSLPRAVVAGLQNCRVISRLGAGTDKIAVDLATERGILVTNVPNFCADEQADHTLALLLMLARRMPQMSAAMAAGTYSDARAMSRTNQRLAGQTLGLVGFGHSARLVAQRAAAFGLRVIATRRNRTRPDPVAEALGVTLTDLDTVLRESDYLSLHAPLQPDTYHLIDAAAIAKIKPGAYFINTSRGALVDEPALVAALRSGQLAGAGLDTFESIDVFAPETGPAQNALFGLENVILTPHVAAGSVQAMQAVSRGGVENVVAVLSGYWPQPGQIVNADVTPRWPLRAHDPAIFAARKAAAA